MAVTAYTGPPGSGKSHALVKDVIVPAVLAGRRIVSNVDGLNPDAIRAYCLEREPQWQVDHADKLGQVVLFHGEDSRKGGFWPDEDTQREGRSTFVQPGDLVVFDEWAMFYPNGEKHPPECNVEAFMRWHRHLTHPVTGAATDLAIATQSISDFHRRHRPLLTRSYLFKKLTAVGADGSYTWHAFDGRLQRQSYLTGTGKYDPAIFPLYASSSAAKSGNHTELRTNKKETIWGGWKAKAVIGGFLAGVVGVGWSAYSLMQDTAPVTASAAAEGSPSAEAPGRVATAAGPVIPPPSPWRIVGQIEGEFGTRIVVADNSGATRLLPPAGFSFDDGRPVSGTVDGKLATADDRLPQSSGPSGSPFGGILQ